MTCSHTFGHHAVVQRYGFIGKTGGHFHASSFEYIFTVFHSKFRGIATCMHVRTCVPEKVEKKNKDLGFEGGGSR